MALFTILYALQAALQAAAIVPLRISTAPVLDYTYQDSTTCTKYECAGSKVNMGNSTCILFDGDKYALKSCSEYDETPYCNPEFAGHNVICTPTPYSVSKSYPGEYCKKSNNCLYGTCVENACFYKQSGENCTLHEECNPGLYCKATICSELIEIGQTGCTDDYQCVNNAGCDHGTCKKYFSVGTKEWVNSCPSNHTSYLCESSFCFNGLCLDAPESSFSSPKVCGDDGVCISTDYEESEGVLFYSSCQCGYNSDSNKYCSLFPGDKSYQKLLSYYREWMASSEVLKCNTIRRWTYECISDYMDKDTADNIDYYSTISVHYAQIQNADDCVYEIVYPRSYSKLIQENEDDDFSLSLLVSIAFLLSLI